MAQKVIREFVDDIDGSPAERTFSFAVDGVFYEIDLSTQNIAEFTSAVGGFLESARKVKGGSQSSRGPRSRGAGAGGAGQSREQIRAVREWARRHGYSISQRGRIPASVQQAFDQAHTAA